MNKEGADMQNRTLQVIIMLFIIKYFKQSGESRYYFDMDKEIRTLFIGVFVDLPKIPIFKKMFLISYEDTLKEYGHDFGQILWVFFFF